MTKNIPVLGFIGWSGAGKTTLLMQLIPLFRARGLRLALGKHTHHDFQIDHPGKDSYLFRQAGANQVLIAGRQRWAVIGENHNTAEPDFAALISYFDQAQLDLIFVEGFKQSGFPSIEVHRPSCGRPVLFPDYPQIIAVACDAELAISCPLPVLNLNDPQEIAKFIWEWCARL